MAEITDPILREAAGIDTVLAPLLDKEILQAPVYEADFVSTAFPAFNGRVVVRYATTGDTMDIESLSLGGGFFREAVATLSTCITKAPASWYQVPPMGKVPALNLRNVADAEALADLYRGYSAWREAFRTSGK